MFNVTKHLGFKEVVTQSKRQNKKTYLSKQLKDCVCCC